MVAFCNTNNIILQVVVSNNHLMQARVDGAIGISKLKVYLHSDSATPSVWMFDMISRTTTMVSK